MSLDQKYAVICEIVDNLDNYYECYGDDEAHATIQTEYTGDKLKVPLKRDGRTWYMDTQRFHNTSTLVEYIVENNLFKETIKVKYAPRKDIEPPPYQIVTEGYDPSPTFPPNRIIKETSWP